MGYLELVDAVRESPEDSLDLIKPSRPLLLFLFLEVARAAKGGGFRAGLPSSI